MIVSVERVVKARLRVEAVACEEEVVGVGGGVPLARRPAAIEDLHLAVRVVHVPLDAGAHEERDVKVGISAVIQSRIALVEKVAVGVLVARAGILPANK